MAKGGGGAPEANLTREWSALVSASLNTSIVKKQIVAITGLLMGFFVLGHLAGNFLIFAGPEAYNEYSEFLLERTGLIWTARSLLSLCLVIHVFFAVRLYLENRAARPRRYAIEPDLGRTTFAKRSMIFSGLLVFFFLWLHLADFTLAVKTGEDTVIQGLAGGEGLGLFGLVWNSFLFSEFWWRPLIYLGVVIFLGMHLSHGFQSIFQTYGYNHERFTPWIERLSLVAGVIIALGFGSIPLYVNLLQTPRL